MNKVYSVFWHRVDSDSTPAQFLDQHNPTQAMFREQIGFLTSRFTPISIAAFLRLLDGEESIRTYARPPVLLGFDDGFRSVITNGLPVLRDFDAPAVFFVTAKLIENPGFVPWFVEVKQLIRRAPEKRIVYQGKGFNLTSSHDRVQLRRCVGDRFRVSRLDGERDGLLSELANLLNCSRPHADDLDDDLRLVRREDLSSLKRPSLIAISSHAMTHRFLTRLTREEQEHELVHSDRVLRQFGGSYFPVIAYPAGCFNGDTVDIATKVYEAGFAVSVGASYRNRYAYPRLGIEAGGVREVSRLFIPLAMYWYTPLRRMLAASGILRR